MKIISFTDFFFPAIGGVPTSIINMSVGLIGQGHDVTIIAPLCPQDIRYVPPNEKIHIIFLPSVKIHDIFRFTLPHLFSLHRTLKKINPDVIHVHSLLFLGWYGVLMAKLLKKPLVGSFHSYFMEKEATRTLGLHNLNFLTNFLWNCNNFFYSFCDLVVAPAMIAKKDLELHGLKKPITFIPNSINEASVSRISTTQIDALKHKYKLKKNVALFVGRLVLEKDVHILIKSMVHILAKNPDTSLFLVGDGNHKQVLVELTKHLKLTQNVIFAGNIPQKDILTKGYFQIGDVFVSASTSEVHPVSLVEAIYFGLPLIGVSKRGIGEMIKNVGLLSEPGNEHAFAINVLKVLDNANLKATLSDNSIKAYQEKYQWEKTVLKYEAALKNIVK